MFDMLLPMLGIKKDDLPPPEKLQAGFAAVAALPDTIARIEGKLDQLLNASHNAPSDIAASKSE